MKAGQPSRADLLVLASAHNEALGRSVTGGKNRRAGMRVLLDCLQAAPGETWQDRWQTSGLEAAADWKTATGAEGAHTRDGVGVAAQLLFCHRVIQPGYAWLQRQGFSVLAEEMGATTDAADFARVVQAAGERQLAPRTLGNVLLLLARVLVHTGKHLDELTGADLFEYADAFHERGPGRGAGRVSGLHATHMLLRHMGVVRDDPISVGSRQRSGRRSVPEMVDRHDLTSPKVRQLLIAYLTERAPGLDYASLRQIEIRLVGTFWADINRHHPEMDTIVLPAGVAHAWKDRIRLLADGTPRRDLPKLFMVVRGFYLDIAEWAAEDPATWGQWVTPLPITDADMRQFAHHKHHQRARMHARIRTLAPTLPVLVASVRRHLDEATELLAAASTVAPGEVFAAAGRRWRRRAPGGRRQGRGQPDVFIEPASDSQGDCRPVNCTLDEEDAFWTWAIVEILRLTGLRIEELMELTHLSIRHYRTADGQLVVLLQVAPSKSDRERVLPVSPELAHALAVVVARVRGDDGKIPTICRYDRLEHELSPPLPFLLQRVRGDQQVLLTGEAIGVLLRRASQRAELRDLDGQPLAFTAMTSGACSLPRRSAPGCLSTSPPNSSATSTSTPLRPTWRSTPTTSCATARTISHGAGRCDPRRNTGRPAKRNGPSSSSISVAARWRLGIVSGPTAPTARTSTPASAARCFGSTPPRSAGSTRSRPTPTGCSPRPENTDGRARPPGWRRPWSTSPTSEPRQNALSEW